MLLLFATLIVLSLVFSLQPKISDEWYFIWNYQDSDSAFDFIVYEYTKWMGRGWAILFATFILPNPLLEIIYRAFIAIEIVILICLAWYCALGQIEWKNTIEKFQSIAIFGCLMWIALPARDETVVWLAGNFVYLVSAIFALGFMAYMERNITSTSEEYFKKKWRLTALGISSFLVGFAAGVSHEQVVAACFAYLLLIPLRLQGESKIKLKIQLGGWCSVLGLFLGAALLVCAPGNYTRMEQIPSPSFLEIIERMMLFVSGAFFELGTGSAGKNIWLPALVLILLQFNNWHDSKQIIKCLKRGFFWWIISLFSLLAMAPATNFISPRTTFFAVIFLFIGLASITYQKASNEVKLISKTRPTKESLYSEREHVFAKSTVVLIILAFIVFVEAIVSLITNTAISEEFSRRIEIVDRAKYSIEEHDNSPIQVPFIATQPAALTYIQTPEHDRDFLVNWGRRIGRPIMHDVRENAPFPNSFKPFKSIKNRHRE